MIQCASADILGLIYSFTECASIPNYHCIIVRCCLRTVITVNGRAWYDPVYAEDGSLDDANSRRVEIKFRLRDEEMIDAMIEILEKGE